MSQEWVAIAVLGRTRGNRGELTAIPLTSKLERFGDLAEVYLFGAGERAEVEAAWFHEGRLIFKFRGIDSISDAERLSGCEVRVPLSDRVPLEADEYFQDDLLGCEAFERGTGGSLGRVAAWHDTGGPGLLELEDGTLIPFARAICVEIDIPARRIVVDLPEGLKELNRQ